MTKNTTKPATAPAPSVGGLEIICTEFRAFEKNSLIGFATLTIPSVGLRLYECGFFSGDNGPWVNYPHRSYEQNGTKKWQKLVDATDKIAHSRFQRSAIAAIQKFRAASGANASTPADDEQVPF